MQQYQKMQSKLVGCNLELMGVIRESECEVHDEVTSLLEQYEKFRVSLDQYPTKTSKQPVRTLF